MSRPPSMHSKFFSSLKQVEKRLKLEHPSHSTDLCSPAPTPISYVQFSSLPVEEGNTDSLVSSPLYLHVDHQSKQCSTLEDSELPREFLSMSNEFPTAAQEEPLRHSLEKQLEVLDIVHNNEGVINDIQVLLKILHLSSFEREEEEGPNKGNEEGRPGNSEKRKWVSSDLESGVNAGKDYCFSADLCGKFTGVKGPKCQKEVQRLEGWIKHFGNDGRDFRASQISSSALGESCFSSGGMVMMVLKGSSFL